MGGGTNGAGKASRNPGLKRESTEGLDWNQVDEVGSLGWSGVSDGGDTGRVLVVGANSSFSSLR
jgi:hypothetical protein